MRPAGESEPESVPEWPACTWVVEALAYRLAQVLSRFGRGPVVVVAEAAVAEARERPLPHNSERCVKPSGLSKSLK